jgi:sigma-B regulation protein RsbU (phosphoserine phosphatase)
MSDMFVTAAVLRIDTQHGHYQYASAGHLPPFLLSGGELVEWETATLPLGFGPGDTVPEISGVLSPGDSLVFYTDGILETRSASGEIVGFENLREWVRDANDSPNGVLNGVKQRLEKYRKTQNRQDDETLVVLHFGI